MTTVLVVEDEALIADDIQRTLRKLGYQVPTTVMTGEAALALTDQLRPNLVLMDIKLRGPMDGIESAAAIRTRHNVPIVYLTSHSDEATLGQAMGTNPHGYLLKPFTDRELRTAIEVALNRHGLEVRLAERERWFSTTLRSIGDAVIATDPNLSVTFLNPVAERLTGRGQEAVGQPLDQVLRLVDEGGRPLPDPVATALAESSVVELPPNSGLIQPTGQRVPIDDSAAPITAEQGEVLGGVVVFRDVSEKRRLEARVAQAERLAALGTMAAGIAHEINNPLTYLGANLDFAKEELDQLLHHAGPDNIAAQARLGLRLREVQACLREASDGARRVRAVTQKLRTFVRADSRSPGTVELPPVVDGAVKMTAHAVRHHAQLDLELGVTPKVPGDVDTLSQVVVNLLLNAAQAIGAGQAADHRITIRSGTDAAGWAYLEVSDTGPGIPPAILPRIFDPFFTTKAPSEGMGLGLAICHSQIRELGGELTAKSPPGGGAVLRLRLPPAEQPKEAAPPSPTPKAAAGRSGTVLVVDDEPSILSIAERVLRGEHRVSVCSNGAEALKLIEGGLQFDVIFMDVMMPRISGLEVYQRIMDHSPAQAQKVVFMSGGAFSTPDRERLLTLGNPRLDKPFTPDELRALTRRLVG